MINIIDNILKCVTEIKPKSLIKKINSSKNQINLFFNEFYDFPFKKLNITWSWLEDEIFIFGEETGEKVFKDTGSIKEIPNIIYQILKIQSKDIYFELSSYSVNGNNEDGYEVNDIYNKQIFSEEVFIFRNEIILSDKEVIDLIAWGKDIVVEWNDCYIKSSDGKI